jgi:hypothetical protein
MNCLSQKFMLGVAGLAIAAGTVVSAENLVKAGDAENVASVKKWHKKLIQNTQDKVTGKSSFQGNVKSIWAFSPGFIEIDPTKAYKLSGSFKSIGKDKGRAYLGLVMCDAKKRTILRSYITIKKGSFTQLAAAAKVGDKVLKLTDCTNWNKKASSRTIIAFGAKKDFSDLPNYNLSPAIIKLEKKADVYEVTLKSPLKKAYPAGTEVRQHHNFGGYQYCAASSKLVPNKWTKYSGVVKGLVKSGAPNKQFWPGTKYARVVVILNYQAKQGSDCKTLFDDISLVKVDEKK